MGTVMDTFDAYIICKYVKNIYKYNTDTEVSRAPKAPI